MRSEDGLKELLYGLSPLEFARQVLKFEPDAAQAKVLGQAPNFKQIALNCSRQWGKSTVAAVLAVHRLVMHRGVTVLVVGPTGRQAGETLRKIRELLQRIEVPLRGDGVNANSMALPNGSRAVGLPAVEGTVRGYSAASMLIVDEASRVPDSLYLALRPSLAVADGDLILVSTPYGRRGFFYREMTDDDPRGLWLRHTGTVLECPRVPAEFLEEERRKGEAYFRQEYLCEFVETGRHLLDQAVIRRMEKKEEKAWDWA